MTDRERAFHLLRRIERESLYATAVLHEESGFVRTLVLGVLRWRSRLDAVMATLAQRRVEKFDKAVVEILRIGIYQLMFMEVAPFAAVSETVELAKRHASRARGFVNAVMRRASEADLASLGTGDLATATAHPKWLIDRWTASFGRERTAAIAEANQQLSFPDVLALGATPPPGGIASTLVDGLYRLHESSAALDRQDFYPMDEGSGVVASIAVSTGKEILDLAAAPGGKSLFMATRRARVVSNDVSISRLRPLTGRSPMVVSDGRQPPFRRRFQTVLLDAPCSATGTIRKNPEIKWRLREADLRPLAALQKELLASALELTEETCVYATCSLEREENDEVVAAAIGDRFEIADLAPHVPAGARAWIDGKVLRLTPESGADGFTAFVLKRR